MSGLSSGGSVAETASASFARPANTTQYASGDLVANSATAASVAALSFPGGGRHVEVE